MRQNSTPPSKGEFEIIETSVDILGIRRRDSRVGYAERGLVQGLDADHAAPARQLDAVDVRHTRGRG